MAKPVAGSATGLVGLPVTFSFAAARSAGVSRETLSRLVNEARLDRLSRGWYRRADAPLADLGLIEVVVRAPRATLCLTSALAEYGLTDDIPAATDVALPRGTRPPATPADVRWHFFERATFDVGRDVLDLDTEITIGLYSAERCIIDAFRTRGSQGHDLAHEALRRWLRRRGNRPAQLLELAVHWPRVVPPRRTAVEILL